MRNEWSYTSAPTTCFNGMDRNKFSFSNYASNLITKLFFTINTGSLSCDGGTEYFCTI